MTDTTETTKPLNQFSATLLAGMLASGEWYENPGQLYRAGQILEEVLPESPPEPIIDRDRRPTAEERATHKAWATLPAAWKREPTPKEIEVLRTCIRKFAERKALQGSIHLLPLLNLASLKPED